MIVYNTKVVSDFGTIKRNLRHGSLAQLEEHMTLIMGECVKLPQWASL